MSKDCDFCPVGFPPLAVPVPAPGSSGSRPWRFRFPPKVHCRIGSARPSPSRQGMVLEDQRLQAQEGNLYSGRFGSYPGSKHESTRAKHVPESLTKIPSRCRWRLHEPNHPEPKSRNADSTNTYFRCKSNRWVRTNHELSACSGFLDPGALVVLTWVQIP